MCGIIGYIGSQEVVPVLIEALRRLEYRGYDSAGVAVVDGDEVRVRRSAGKLSNLEEAIRLNPLHGYFGIGHTRWATHGRPTEENAHPHRDCTRQIVVVHNGIIENYLELKHALERDHHQFVTETDTEVIAHLIEKHYDGNLENAVLAASAEMEGVYSCVILSAAEPNKIIGLRNGPPLVLGVGEQEFFVASDIPALLQHTRNVIFLNNGEIAILTDSGARIVDFSGDAVSRDAQVITWDAALAEKGDFTHYMLKEIFEQPRAIRETIENRFSLETGKVYLNDFSISSADLAAVRKINIVAAGTSWHAALVGKYLLEEIARIPTEVDISSEFRYRKPIVCPNTLTLAITQSGETADTIAAIKEARELGSRVMAISNVIGSMITRETEGTIYTHAGPEIGVASTKAFTTQLVALHLFAMHMAQLRFRLSEAESVRMLQGLMTIANLVEAVLQKQAEIEVLIDEYTDRTDFLYLGRGMNYPIALEGALKLKEISYIHAEGYPAGEMKHGPIALIDDRMPVVVLMPRDRHYEKIRSNVMEAKSRGGNIIIIATEGDRSAVELSRHAFYVPPADPLLIPILCTIPMQLIAYHIAVRLDRDVDQPRNLAKSVTVE